MNAWSSLALMDIHQKFRTATDEERLVFLEELLQIWCPRCGMPLYAINHCTCRREP